MSHFALDDGSTVEVKQTYGASILVEKRPEAFEWLRDNGYDDIIKNTVACQFGRGEDDQASAFAAFAQQQGYVPDQKQRYTLKRYVRSLKNVAKQVRVSYGIVWGMGRSTRSY